jgi:hypothetical protein
MNLKTLLLLLASPFLALTAATVRADVWTLTPIPPKAAGGSRTEHTAVWTGKEMIVWGGAWGSNTVSRGGVYDPVSNTWRPTSTENLPSTYLGGHTAVWAGEPVNRMLVYGGSFPPLGRDGGMYDPETDRWTKIEIDGDRRAKPPIPVPPHVPSFRSDHSAVWTGEEMIVWGGHCLDACYRTDGAAFNPLTQQWRPIKTPPFLAGRAFHSAFWTGTKMLVWGGRSGGRPHNDGGLYDPKSDEWTPVTMEGVPSLRTNHGTVWTGREMIVWGGQETLVMADGKLKGGLRFRPDGKIYDPVLDRWRPMSTRGLDTNVKKQPAGQEYHTSVWTGEEMITWGGARGSGATHLGYRYNLEADVWVPVTNTGSPTNRDYHTAVWTGREMIVWAGRGGGGGPLSGGYAGPTGGVYRPTCGVYVFEPQEGARVNREMDFRLHLSPSGAPRQAQLVVDGVPHGDPQTVLPDSRVKFGLGDEVTGQHKLQVRTGGADGSQCQSPEVPVNVGPTVKVLRLIHNPKYAALGGRSFVETIGERYVNPRWSKPYKLSEDFNKTLLDASGGFAKYDIVETVDDWFPLRETNGVEASAEQIYNMMANCGPRPGDNAIFPGWANLEGVPVSAQTDGGPGRGCEETVPNSGLPLGDTVGRVMHAQSFKAWGTSLEKIQLALSRIGSPTAPVRVSVRKSLDGADECNPAGVCGVTFEPGELPDGTQTDPPRVHKDFSLPLEKDVLYYLVVQVPAAQDADNHYWLRMTRTPDGRPAFTDEESKLYQGSAVEPRSDMSAKLMFKHELDTRHLYDVVNFDIGGKSQPISAHVRDGTIDEVQTMTGPLVNMWEGVMMGPDAFGVYGLVEGVQSGRVFVAMWLNYERKLAQALESYAHRVEATMRRVYGGWANDPYFKPLPQPFLPQTNWDRFTTFRGVLPGGVAAACGAAHFPPNVIGRPEYHYKDLVKQASVCDNWLKYPDLRGAAKMVNAATWCAPGKDDDDECEAKFLKWWYTRLPKAAGCNKDDHRLNNWWRYIVEPERYKADPTPPCQTQ